MGLDMYLEGKMYIGGEYSEIEQDITIKTKKRWEKEEKEIILNTKDIREIIIPLSYWRKANSIHRWFVEHCFDGDYEDYHGEDIYVEIEQIKELKKLCKNVLTELKKVKTLEAKKAIINNTLPMQNGFFFGYNDSEEGIKWYEADMKGTIKELDCALKKIKKYNLNELFYSASW